jgi:hypothetical protein
MTIASLKRQHAIVWERKALKAQKVFGPEEWASLLR